MKFVILNLFQNPSPKSTSIINFTQSRKATESVSEKKYGYIEPKRAFCASGAGFSQF